MDLNKLRRWLYRFARLLGDVNAVKRGPKATGKRIERRIAGRATGRTLRRLLK